MIFSRKSSRSPLPWPCGSGSCAEMVRISGSICRRDTICTRRSRNAERRARKFRHWKSPESEDLLDAPLIRAGRAVLKAEWEKVKAEMQGGPFQSGIPADPARSSLRAEVNSLFRRDVIGKLP